MRPRDGRVVPALIGQALAGEPMTVFGDGSQTRSFCYVSDLVDGIYRLLLSDEPDPINIGNPAELSVLEFARTIQTLTGTKSEIVFKPLPVDDPKVRQPDITKARTKLGWEPKVKLEEGLTRTIEYFRTPRSGRALRPRPCRSPRPGRSPWPPGTARPPRPIPGWRKT